MDDQNSMKNLLLTMVLCAAVFIGWNILFPPPDPVVDPAAPTTSQTADSLLPPATTTAQTGTAATTAATGTAAVQASESAAETPRVKIDTPRLAGTIALKGARIDDLALKTYRVTIDPTSDTVRLLIPAGQPHAYYTVHGWQPQGDLTAADVPGSETPWQVQGNDTLTVEKPVTLVWANTKGLTFTRTIAVDDRFMFTITDSVKNAGTTPATLAPVATVYRHGKPEKLENFFISHEGVVGRTDGKLTELKYKKVDELTPVVDEFGPAEVLPATKDGWIGFSDKYWMTVLIPTQGQPFTAVASYIPDYDLYQTITRLPAVTVAPGATIENASRVFAGAKEWETLRDYQNNAAVPGFIDAIDWGWFFFFTKPIFTVLHWLHGLIGNMGLAIIALTFVLKVLVLPLAYKSYVSMARMKELQPELEALKERAGDDKQKMQREMMALYKEKKVNPAAGCLPVLIQIPIFFSLYKVIFVTIELRHAPFFGWLNDLSAPDTSSLFNLFGLLPWAAPTHPSLLATIFIGVLPILLGITMWLQQKLNPAPADPVQQQVFAWMPWIFMFMLGGFASGLVVYWITNNIITFSQQYLIMRSHGHKPDIFGNIKSSFKKKPVPVAANTPKAPVAKGKAKK